VAPERTTEDLLTAARAGDGAAYFVTKLPPSSLDFSFTARLDNGRPRRRERPPWAPRGEKPQER